MKLYLLDSNDPANPPAPRGVTSELYGGGEELRLQQELVLGLGGWRLLGAAGLKPEVCHLNEGHAAIPSKWNYLPTNSMGSSRSATS